MPNQSKGFWALTLGGDNGDDPRAPLQAYELYLQQWKEAEVAREPSGQACNDTLAPRPDLRLYLSKAPPLTYH